MNKPLSDLKEICSEQQKNVELKVVTEREIGVSTLLMQSGQWVKFYGKCKIST